MDEKGFDLWAAGYDGSVARSDEDRTYPFAGYNAILNEIYNRISASSARTVLDIGCGTGILSARLYSRGCRVYGQDFSEEMIRHAQEKMPTARLYLGDFTQGVVPPLCRRRYDAIIATYSLHHLKDALKVEFLKALLPLLRADGRVYIGDVAFSTRGALQACRAEAADRWDDEEYYFVYEELREQLPTLTFEPYSRCAALLTLSR